MTRSPASHGVGSFTIGTNSARNDEQQSTGSNQGTITLAAVWANSAVKGDITAAEIASFSTGES